MLDIDGRKMEGNGGVEYAIAEINKQALNMESALNIKKIEEAGDEDLNIKIREEMQPNLREKHIRKHIADNQGKA